jgi:hypothetical protein
VHFLSSEFNPKVNPWLLGFLLLCTALLHAQANPGASIDQGAAFVLTHILVEKGVLSAADLARIQSAASIERVNLLASILRDKGVLDSQDLARLTGPSTASPLLPQPYVQLAASGPSSATPVPMAPTTVAPSSPNSPSAPQQSLPIERAPVNTGKGIPVTLYGSLIFNAGFNSAGVNIEDAGTVVAKPGSTLIADQPSYFETARQTRIGLRLNPTEIAGAQLTGAFEMDAFGPASPFPNGVHMNLLRMRLAYGRLDWRRFAVEIGQDWSIFAPLNPASIAMYGVTELNAAGNPWTRLPQVRLEAKQTLNSANRLLYQIAVSDPNLGDNDATVYNGARPPGAGELGRMPAIESRLAWSATDKDHDYTIGFSGRYSRGKNIGILEGSAAVQGIDSWGTAIDYSLPFSKLFNLTGEAYIGRALGLYSPALGESIQPVGTAGAHGVLSRGGWAQAQFNLSNSWQLNGGYGIDDPNAHDLPTGARNRNANVFANFIYKLNTNINFSLEYRRLLTYFKDQSALTGRANQVTASAAYLF